MKKHFILFLFVGLLIMKVQTGTTQNKISQDITQIGNTAQYHTRSLGENVFVFDPQMDIKAIQALIDTLYQRQQPRTAEFSTKRYALLFKPGSYALDLKLGYYMQVLGLGDSPEDVIINGTLISRGQKNGNVTCNFWRSVENLTIIPSADSAVIWGVSQAAPMRRVHIKGDIQLHDNGWASGGFLSDSKVDGTVFAGTQQQWFSRNNEFGKFEGGQWNMLFVGVNNAPADKWPDNPNTIVKTTPEIREKPFLIYNHPGFAVNVPQLKENSTGISWANGFEQVGMLPFTGFYIVKPETDDSESINARLKEGKNLLFTPGIYLIDKSLKVKRHGTVIMGIGMATLVSTKGNALLEISDVDGVSICGLIFDAGKISSETLVRVGETGSKKDHAAKPTFLYDVFFRVGGSSEGSAKSCLTINSNNVYVDHTWLWRADHGNGVGWDKNKCANGLIVNGGHVTIYGLFNEHFQEYQTLWNGNFGKVYFYQSELPYDPPTVDAWKHDGIGGYASYKVADKVTSHEAWGLGIYCVFYAAPIIVDNAIETPLNLEKNIHRKVILWLNGNKESKILSILNGKGGGVDASNKNAKME